MESLDLACLVACADVVFRPRTFCNLQWPPVVLTAFVAGRSRAGPERIYSGRYHVLITNRLLVVSGDSLSSSASVALSKTEYRLGFPVVSLTRKLQDSAFRFRKASFQAFDIQSSGALCESAGVDDGRPKPRD